MLKLFLSREKLERFEDLVNRDILSEEEAILFSDFKEYFRVFPSEDHISSVSFREWFFLVRHPKLSGDRAEIFKILLDKIFDGESLSEEEEKQLIYSLIAREYCLNIGNKGFQGFDSDIDPESAIEDIQGLIDNYNQEVDKVAEYEQYLCRQDLEEIVDSLSVKGGFRWPLESLRKSLGPLRKGDFVILGARPDSGKTSMLAFLITNFAQQLKDDEKVLVVHNEEGGLKFKYRCFQSALGKSVVEIRKDISGARERYIELMGGDLNRIEIFDKPGVNVKDVAPVLKQGKFKLIVFDQLWKIHGFEKVAGNEVTRQTMLFNWARELAKKYGPVITSHQADATAQGEKYIDMNQLYLSKTGVQGEADAIITMGRTYEAGMEDIRYLFIPKNKLVDGEETDPAMRNGKWEVIFDYETARFTDAAD